MKCILMNKNTEVLVADYEPSLGVFTEIYEYKNMDYAPLNSSKIQSGTGSF